jgi:hypothetical protein
MSSRACRDCGARIRFLVTPGGRSMPINLDPDPRGNVVIENGVARVLTAEETARATGSRWMPHKATCAAGQQRRRRQ